jgi:hypothetical protein
MKQENNIGFEFYLSKDLNWIIFNLYLEQINYDSE